MESNDDRGQPRKRNRLPASGRGGYRPNAGRPKGAHSRMTKEARAKAEASGKLPHELLLDWARGEPMKRKVLVKTGEVVDGREREVWEEELLPIGPEDMRDAAKAAAPYYAPKISTVEVVTGVSDADLGELIARAAAEAGLSVAPSGAGQEDAREGGQAHPSEGPAGRRRL